MEKSVLIVDDELAIRRLIRRGLELRNFKTSLAMNVAEAKKKMEEGAFDLLITDLNLPDQSGVKLISEFQNKFPGRPAIVISGLIQFPKGINKSPRESPVYLIEKPFTLKNLLKVLDECF